MKNNLSPYLVPCFTLCFGTLIVFTFFLTAEITAQETITPQATTQLTTDEHANTESSTHKEANEVLSKEDDLNETEWLEERVVASEDNIRNLRNNMSELRQDFIGSNERILQRLDELVGEIESLKTQIQTLQESQPNPEATTTTTSEDQSKTPPPADNTTSPLSDKDQYQQAYELLVLKKILQAREAMQQFLVDHPESSLADNAAYWIGETYFAEKNYIDASRQFSFAFETYPESNKAPDNLLKLGISLLRLEKKDEACVTLSALLERYPNAPPYIIDRAKGTVTNIPCPS